MRLRSLAGAYAGQIRDFSTPVGLAAIRSGMAERLDAVTPPALIVRPAAPVQSPPGKTKAKK